ncbi:hypothetical protein GCM10007887_10280 [Methylobacterium haplocladii]|uniref:Uncharacterized protein n=2 Tax=Methylobacterium haplocladii TaxID=1176176 RepID=A0A512IN57_9HYPH|nr:hypothetical protein MHA02_15030 [Methylobacterium haplocladii]GJD84776.1 hypothetical protein HPGCJGGD_2659 [Methylobacterium haplocladii]GLS58368.1 hypothetical protein GCM10007887_10280 [Methylobacterium haplocladii]
MPAATSPLGWPSKFRDTDACYFHPEPTEEVAAWWNRRFYATSGIFPEDFVASLTAGTPGRTSGWFRHIDPIAESFEFDMTGVAADKTTIFFKHKRFEIASGRVGDGETRVWPDWQEKGIGTQLMSNLVELARRIELDRIEIEAQDIGRYAWLPLGFLPERTAWTDRIVPPARRRLALARMAGHIEEDAYRHAMLTLEDTDARAIRRLMELRQLVPGIARDGSAVDVPLFKALMLQAGTDWFGSFNLRDRDSLALFEAWKAGHDARHRPK